MTLGGLALSYAYDLPSGPAIILLGAAILSVVYAGRKLRGGGPGALPGLRQ
jgi:ABC-type Mn2+/Zn2+ transport system permease subunit